MESRTIREPNHQEVGDLFDLHLIRLVTILPPVHRPDNHKKKPPRH